MYVLCSACATNTQHNNERKAIVIEQKTREHSLRFLLTTRPLHISQWWTWNFQDRLHNNNGWHDVEPGNQELVFSTRMAAKTCMHSISYKMAHMNGECWIKNFNIDDKYNIFERKKRSGNVIRYLTKNAFTHNATKELVWLLSRLYIRHLRSAECARALPVFSIAMRHIFIPFLSSLWCPFQERTVAHECIRYTDTRYNIYDIPMFLFSSCYKIGLLRSITKSLDSNSYHHSTWIWFVDTWVYLVESHGTTEFAPENVVQHWKYQCQTNIYRNSTSALPLLSANSFLFLNSRVYYCIYRVLGNDSEKISSAREPQAYFHYIFILFLFWLAAHAHVVPQDISYRRMEYGWMEAFRTLLTRADDCTWNVYLITYTLTHSQWWITIKGNDAYGWLLRHDTNAHSEYLVDNIYFTLNYLFMRRTVSREKRMELFVKVSFRRIPYRTFWQRNTIENYVRLDDACAMWCRRLIVIPSHTAKATHG